MDSKMIDNIGERENKLMSKYNIRRGATKQSFEVFKKIVTGNLILIFPSRQTLGGLSDSSWHIFLLEDEIKSDEMFSKATHDFIEKLNYSLEGNYQAHVSAYDRYL